MSFQVDEYQMLIFDYLCMYPNEYFTFDELRNKLNNEIGILTISKRKDFFTAFDELNNRFSNIDKDYIYADGLQRAIAFVTKNFQPKKKACLNDLPSVNVIDVPNYINKILEERIELFDPFCPLYNKKSVFDYLIDSVKTTYNVNENRIAFIFDKMINNNYSQISCNIEKNLKYLLNKKKELSEIDTEASLELEGKIDKLMNVLSNDYVNALLIKNEKLQENMISNKCNYQFALWASNLAWLTLIIAYFWLK